MFSHSLTLPHLYKIISIIDSSLKFCDEKCLPKTLSRSFCPTLTKKRQRKKKCSAVSVSLSLSAVAVANRDYSILETMVEFVFV